MDTTTSLKAPHLRIGAIPSREMVNVFLESAIKADVGHGYRSIITHLLVKAWVRNVSWRKNVWIDLHVLGKDGSIVHQETLSLQYLGTAGGDGDFFLLKAEVCQSGTVGPGWCTSTWLDDRNLLYRLYYEAHGMVFTDNVLHQIEVESDSHCVTMDKSSLLADLDLDARNMPWSILGDRSRWC